MWAEKAGAGLPHSISAGDEDEALRLRSWDDRPPAQSWRANLIVVDDANSSGGGSLGVCGVGDNLLSPVAVGVVLVGVFDDGRLGERGLRRLLCVHRRECE